MADKAYLIAVDMGYGHQRALFPLLEDAAVPEEWGIAKPMIISGNDYPGIPKRDKQLWDMIRALYEKVSRMNGVSVLGTRIFNAMDYVQRIVPFYPKRDLSKPVFQVTDIYRRISKGFGKHLVETLNKNPIPLITSFFMIAFCAEEHGYRGKIYCLCTDTDVARAWAPLNPKASNIIYLAPTRRVKERLLLYGVKPDNIFITGFPLPKEIVGNDEINNSLVAKNALSRRISRLDPTGIYQNKYSGVLSMYLGAGHFQRDNNPVVITFAVGGAGAQSDIGISILKSLKEHIVKGKIKLNLAAGSSDIVRKIFEQGLIDAGIDSLNEGVNIIFHKNKYEYFMLFNKALIDTDVLWTKPSELSFFAGAGIPIIMSPALGAQEECNKAWLQAVGAGFMQDDPRYTNEWFFDLLDSGRLAESAMNGFMDASKEGTYHIEEVVFLGKMPEGEHY